MRGLTIGYLIRRVVACILTIWLGATIIFLIPRLMPGDPLGALVAQAAQRGASMADPTALIAAWRERFGLNDPLVVQYGRYLWGLTRFDLGYSFRYYPSRVQDLIGQALPWTIGLLTVATLLSFALGNAIGALLAWPRASKRWRTVLPVLLPFTSVPYFMLGILLMYVFVFTLPWFPAMGAYDPRLVPGFNIDFVLSVIRHGTLPALSIILTTMGSWALTMRGMMISTAGEDYMMLGEAKGLKPRRLFWRYGMRNAILPQVTDLTLAIGGILGGQVLVEILFAYPGIGYQLYQGIINNDFALINGIVFMLVVATAVAVLVIDVVYPMLDPRISYRKRL